MCVCMFCIIVCLCYCVDIHMYHYYILLDILWTCADLCILSYHIHNMSHMVYVSFVPRLQPMKF